MTGLIHRAKVADPTGTVELLVAVFMFLIGYELRWPWALFWMKSDRTHNYYQLSMSSRDWFVCLCIAGIACQLFAAAILLIAYFGHYETASVVLLGLASVYLVLTVVRFVIWIATFEK